MYVYIYIYISVCVVGISYGGFHLELRIFQGQYTGSLQTPGANFNGDLSLFWFAFEPINQNGL